MPDRWTLPALDARNRAFFTSGRLVLQKCARCGVVQHPPEEMCHACHSMDFETRECRGRGTVYSFIVAHHAANPALRERVPYAVILVSLDEMPEVRIVGNLLDVSPDRVWIGMPVRTVWERIEESGETLQLPQWKALEEDEHE